MGFFSNKPKPNDSNGTEFIAPISEEFDVKVDKVFDPIQQEVGINLNQTSQKETINNTINNLDKKMNNGTIISEGTILEGQIKIETMLTVDGTVKGNITSKAKVTIGPTGKVEGDITCPECEINGTYFGNLKVAEMLFLKGNAKVDGEITTGKMVIEAGVQFNGKCNMGGAAVANAAPKPAATIPNPIANNIENKVS
jgi:cytoskeletal protein CcmA (bactofilin family)